MNVQVRESFVIRVWTEPGQSPLAAGQPPAEPVLRGSIQHVASGHKTYFTSLDLPVALLRASVERLGGHVGPLA
jgi:hypothetical protein